MSQAVPCGRATPRWSTAGGGQPAAVSIAGLPTSSACVIVGPPLSASGPSSGFVLGISPAPVSEHVSSLSMFEPPVVMPPRQSPPTLSAKIVLVSVTTHPETSIPPPGGLVAVLRVTVVWRSVSEPTLAIVEQ